MACVLVSAAVHLACAPAQGWAPTAQRTCERATPATICAEVTPDRPLRFDLGGTAIVPGECARAPAKGGLVRIAVDDGRSGELDYRWIRAPRGRITWVSVREDKLWLRVDRRQRCDREPTGEPSATIVGPSTAL